MKLLFSSIFLLFTLSLAFDVTQYTSTQVLTITGTAGTDPFLFPISNAGDVNHDGRDDIIVGGYGLGDSGLLESAYLIYGQVSFDPVSLNFNTMKVNPAAKGIAITGTSGSNGFGSFVSGAGNINGDLFDDFMIGAHRSGKVYVVYGGSSLMDMDVSTGLDPATTGFTITGDSADYFGFSISKAGKIRGGTLDDIIIGAHGKNTKTGAAVVIYGDASRADPVTVSGATATITPSTAGFAILGKTAGDMFGYSVSNAGDVNGDTIDDIIIGAPGKGAAYVVYGKSTPVDIDLSAVDLIPSSNGFTILGETAGDYFGISVSAAGDVDGDGIDDVIIGANNTGKAYVIYGSNSPVDINLASDTLAAASNGFIVKGTGNQFGFSVTSLGDLNGDSKSEVMIGAPGGSGKVYVIYGGNMDDEIDLSVTTLDVATNGFTFERSTGDNGFGYSVSSGDFNGNSKTELFVGTMGTSSAARVGYVIDLSKMCSSDCTECDFPSTCKTCNNNFGLVDATLQCVACGTTQYYSNNKCESCLSHCETCTDGLTCDSCSSGYHKYNPATGTQCIDCTDTGKFVDGSGECHDCIANCDSCIDGSTCDTCSSGFGFFGGQCSGCIVNCDSCIDGSTCDTCSTGFRYDGTQCVGCISHCDSCADSSTCTTCSSGFDRYNSDTQCIDCAVPGKFLDAGECKDCISDCAQCSDTTTCDACSSGFGFGSDNSECVSCSSGSGHYVATNGECTACLTNCNTCSDGSTCTTCSSGFDRYNSDTQCIDCAVPGKFLDAGECKDCISDCAQCSDTTTCTTCSTRFRYDGTQCVGCIANCDDCADGSTCTTCSSGFDRYNSNTQCIDCSVAGKFLDAGECKDCISDCAQCSDTTTCDTCSTGFRYDGAHCVGCISHCDICADGSTCTTCSSGFDRYNSNTQCIDCTVPGKFLDAGGECHDCISDCAQCSDSTTCNTCSTGFRYDGTQCVGCISHCDVCADGSTCTTCSSGFDRYNSDTQCIDCTVPGKFLDAGGECHDCISDCAQCSDSTTCNTCSTGFRYDGTQCVGCISNCDVCADGSTCTTCSSGFDRYNSNTQCIDCSVPGKFLDAGECKDCISDCAQCSDTTTCDTCSAGFRYDGTQCVGCISNCDACADSSTCTTCSSGFDRYNSDTQCVDCTVSGKFLDAGECKDCIPDCAQCSDTTTCDTCSAGKGKYLGGCSICPPTTYLLSGVCEDCIDDCDQCSDATTCDVCSSDYVKVGSGCVFCDPQGHYISADGQCTACLTNCKTCSSSLTCTACSMGFERYSSDTQCIDCNVPGKFLDAGECKDCILDCAQCSDTTTCDACSAGKGKYLGGCTICPPTTYLLNGVCEDCIDDCDQCSDATTCDVCSDHYGLLASVCVPCPTTGKYKAADGQCTDCIDNCDLCEDSAVCSTCLSHYGRWNSGTECISCPQTGKYLAAAGDCLDCIANCDACTDSATCLTCSSGYGLLNSLCIPCPQEGMYWSNGNCLACSEGCSQCTDSATCQVCKTDYLLSDWNTCVEKKEESSNVGTSSTFEAASLIGAAFTSGSSLPFNFGMTSKMVRNVKYLDISVSPELRKSFVSWSATSNFLKAPKSWNADVEVDTDSEADSGKRRLQEVFGRYGMEPAFLINYWKTLVMTIIGVGLYAIFKIVEVCFSKQGTKLHKISRAIHIASSNFALTQFYSNLDDVVLYLAIDSRSTAPATTFTSVSFNIGVILLIVGVISLIVHVWLLKKYQDLKKQRAEMELLHFKTKSKNVNLIFKDFKDDGWAKQAFLLIILVRCIVASLIFAILYEHPFAQILMLLIINISMIIFLIIVKPFKDIIDTCGQFFSEIMLLMVNICMFILSSFGESSAKHVNDIARLSKCVIVLNIMLLIGCAIFLLLTVLRLAHNLYKIYKEKQASKEASVVLSALSNKLDGLKVPQQQVLQTEEIGDSKIGLNMNQSRMHTQFCITDSSPMVGQQNSNSVIYATKEADEDVNNTVHDELDLSAIFARGGAEMSPTKGKRFEEELDEETTGNNRTIKLASSGIWNHDQAADIDPSENRTEKDFIPLQDFSALFKKKKRTQN